MDETAMECSTVPPDADSSPVLLTVAAESEPKQFGPQPEAKQFVPQDSIATVVTPGKCGLYNLGNTCYMNSGLQCLLHNPGLLEYFLSQKYSRPNSGLLLELNTLIEKYWCGKWSIIVPKSFKDSFSEQHPQFLGNSQHDGQEFLALFLGSIHAELMSVKHSTAVVVPRLNAKICNDLTLPGDNQKRKRTESIEYLDNCLPSQKSIDETAASCSNFLNITSFIGKEKKTPNVNVLNAEVECDEETTTDHSNKFPQVSGSRLNNGQLFQQSSAASPAHPREQDLGEMELDGEGDIKMLEKQKKGDVNCSKQTNLIADLRRHQNDPAPADADLGKATQPLRENKAANPAEEPELEKVPFKPLIKSIFPGLGASSFDAECLKATCFTDGASDGYLSDSDGYLCTPAAPLLKRASTPVGFSLFGGSSSTCLGGPDLLIENSKRRKIFSLHRHNRSAPRGFPGAALSHRLGPLSSSLDGPGGLSCLTSNNRNPALHVSHEPNSGLESFTGERGSLVTKFTNILVDDDSASHSAHVSPSHQVLGELHTSNNLRSNDGQLQPVKKSGEKTKQVEYQSPADAQWEQYTCKNNSVIVDNFQGQLESTVSCRKCGHRSVTYEPFMYLSVPIPHALHSLFDIRIVPVNGAVCQVSLYVLRQGKVQDLREALALELADQRPDLDLTNFLFCEVRGGFITQVMDNVNPLRNLTSCRISAVEVVCGDNPTETGTPTESQEEPEQSAASDGTWNCCCICLEDFADSELLRHSEESCSIMICHACLESSVEHYGSDSFSCPICHGICSPYQDFVRMASSSNAREVAVSVSFVYLVEGKATPLSHPFLLRTSTEMRLSTLKALVAQVTPKSLRKRDDHILTFSSLDGRTCSRCPPMTPCPGCVVPDDPDDPSVTLRPGDNICVRYSSGYDENGESAPLFDDEGMTQQRKPVTLDMCLETFAKNEPLDENNPWYCTSCCSRQLAEKQLRICRWPDTLILYIKRFLYHSKAAVKVDDEVVFPVSSFNPGLLGGTEQSGDQMYDLTACISHYGGVHSGHYTAHCKHADSGQWHLYNDEEVSEAELGAKNASNVYVLFYKKRDHAETP